MRRYSLARTLFILRIAWGVLFNETFMGIEKYTAGCLTSELNRTQCFPTQDLSQDENIVYEEVLWTSRLKGLFSDMNSYITKKRFCYILFEYDIEKLRQDLYLFQYIVIAAEANHELETQVDFVSSMFLEMIDAARIMKQCSARRDHSCQILFELYDLKIRVYKLQDINGDLNSQIYSQEAQLYKHFKSLYVLEDAISKEKGLSKAMYDKFYAQFGKIKLTLDTLERQILASKS